MSSELIDAGQRLANVLAQENEALLQSDFSTAVALVAAKEAALAELTRQPRPSTLPPRAVALGQHLNELAAENQALLQRAVAVQTRIVRIVARACAAPTDAMRYTSIGSRTPATRNAALAVSTRA